MLEEYSITPVPKPRMTQRDKWAKRPAVMRYRQFCDQCRESGVTVPDGGAHVRFIMPMPKSWSAKKKAEMAGQPHQQKPDLDNLLKALFDATRKEDSGIYSISAIKEWGDHGRIIINRHWQ
ncbi:RusA family crossover junction endodeoxyribonuclease [Oceanospirillum phage vB_OliS_GJ44]|nr:RusA family crossover junction endodeoxyribonuclease [Oceanospirillum phage vB_OliS_GJ44]